jgi:hypothetical protein
VHTVANQTNTKNQIEVSWRCSAILRLALPGHEAQPLQSKTVEQLPSKEGSAYPFDLCKQKGGRRSGIKQKRLKPRTAVLSDIHSLAQDGKICKGFFQKTFTFYRKNHQILSKRGISFGGESEWTASATAKSRAGKRQAARARAATLVIFCT